MTSSKAFGAVKRQKLWGLRWPWRIERRAVNDDVVISRGFVVQHMRTIKSCGILGQRNRPEPAASKSPGRNLFRQPFRIRQRDVAAVICNVFAVAAFKDLCQYATHARHKIYDLCTLKIFFGVTLRSYVIWEADKIETVIKAAAHFRSYTLGRGITTTTLADRKNI